MPSPVTKNHRTLRTVSLNVSAFLIHGLLFCVVIFLLSVLLSNGWRSLWIVQNIEKYDLRLLAFIALYLFACRIRSCEQHRKLSMGLIVFIAVTMYLSFRGPALGDNSWSNPPTGVLLGSSILGHFELLMVRAVHLSPSLLPVISGVAAAFAFVAAADDLIGYHHPGDYRRGTLARMLYMGSALHVLFFFGFLEVTSPAVPVLILSFLFFQRYLRSAVKERHSSLLWAVSLFTLSCLIHGQNTFLFPCIPAAIILKHWKNGTVKGAFLDVVLSVGAVSALWMVMYGCVSVLGYTIVPGDINGGGDGMRFLPVSTAGLNHPVRLLMFTNDHYLEVMNILIATAPGIIVLPIVFFIHWRKNPGFLSSPVIIFLSIAALGYIAFAFLWGFDLGFPTDLDLMFAMSSPLILLVTVFITRLPKLRFLAVATGLWSILHSWLFISGFLMKL